MRERGTSYSGLPLRLQYYWMKESISVANMGLLSTDGQGQPSNAVWMLPQLCLSL